MHNEKEVFYIYEKYQKQMFQFVNRQIRSIETSEEIVQDVFFAYAEAIRNKTKIISISAYLYSTARNKIVDYIRRKKVKGILFSTISENFINLCTSFLFEEKVQKQEVEDCVQRVLERLPHDYALVIRLKYIEGFTVKAIAHKWSTSFKRIESLLFRARKRFIQYYKMQKV